MPKLNWQNFSEKPIKNPEEKVEKILTEFVSKKLAKSNRISIALSGGVDSTFLLALIRKNLLDLDINAISVRFSDGFDETKRAKKIADYFDAQHDIVQIDNYFEDLPKAISVLRKPFWDIHWYYVAKKAKEFSSIIVSGDGGDELFGGYTFRYEKYLSLVNKKSSTIDKVKAYLQCHERDWVPDQEKLFGKKANFSWKRIYNQLVPYFNNSLPLLNQVFLADFNGKLLYNWLPNGTRICKHFKLKPIIPILSTKLMSLATHIPLKQKYDEKNSTGKIILQKLLKKYQIEKLTLQKKQGFSVDTVKTWESYGQKLCLYFLTDARVTKHGLINSTWVNKYMHRKDLDHRFVNKFYGILALEIWYRMFVTKEMSSSENIKM
jgi:asparagine synthase (glutamine-hydrolysing)